MLPLQGELACHHSDIPLETGLVAALHLCRVGAQLSKNVMGIYMDVMFPSKLLPLEGETRLTKKHYILSLR